MTYRISFVLLLAMAFVESVPIAAQDDCDCVYYKLVPQTQFQSKPLTVSQLVNETVMEPRQITTYKPVWTREKRERRTTVLKPVVKTSERVERYLVRRPIVETSYKEKQIQETSYQTVTEMRAQRWLVEKPVVETQYREEKVVVRKPVTKTMLQTEYVTTLKPVTIRETQFVQGATVTNDLVLETGRRNRLRWLQPGEYVDPLNCQTAFRQRGLHWVPDRQLALRPTIKPALFEQQIDRTVYQSETVQVQKPVQVTEYVEQYETRRVPVQVSKTSREIMVTKTPVTVQKPVTTVRTEKVPVREVKYREEILVRRVPVTETTYQRVDQVETYEVEVCKWVAETSEIKVPRTITRRIDYSINQTVPRTVMMRVPVDAWGNIAGTPTPVATTQTQTTYRYPVSERIISAPVVETYKPLPSGTESSTVVGEPIIVRKIGENEFRELEARNEEKPDSVLIPTLQTDASKPASDTVVVKKPTLADSDGERSDEGASGVRLDLPESPSTNDQDSGSGLEIDSSDSADIDSRTDSADEDSIPLSGSN